MLCKRDIAEDPVLMEAYALHIPVLELEGSGGKLYWPFAEAELADFINKYKNT